MKTILEQIEEARAALTTEQYAVATEIARQMAWQDQWRMWEPSCDAIILRARGIIIKYINAENRPLRYVVRENGDVVADLSPMDCVKVTLRQDGQCEGLAPRKQHDHDKVPLDVWVPLVACYDIARDSEPLPA